MKVTLHREPFSHLIVSGFFSEDEYNDVWFEIQYLSKRMKPPNETYAAHQDGVYRKKGSGVFLHEFLINPAESSTFRATRKIFDYQEAVSQDFYLNGMYRWVNHDVTLAQLYLNGDYYKPHWDTPILTHITVLHKTPKPYTGGDLFFPEFNYTVSLKDNESILFPSFAMHEVTQVRTDSDDLMSGRYTVTNFMQYLNPSRKQ
jgi:hypothetical protein